MNNQNDLPCGTYQMRVDRIVQARRAFTMSGSQRFVHDIFLVSNTGVTYRGEHVTGMPTQNDFHPGEVCCFMVTNSQKHEISKCAPQQYGGYDQEDDTFAPSTTNVSGKSYCFAMNWAVQISVAQIRMGHVDGTEAGFMQEIKNKAWEMHQWLLNPTGDGPVQSAEQSFYSSDNRQSNYNLDTVPF